VNEILVTVIPALVKLIVVNQYHIAMQIQPSVTTEPYGSVDLRHYKFLVGKEKE
jgi:hypothetical protein